MLIFQESIILRIGVKSLIFINILNQLIIIFCLNQDSQYYRIFRIKS